jgi:hypothetical protein
MASPIFSHLIIKKYILQVRSGPGSPWRERAAYRRLAEAEQARQTLLRQDPQIETRILNRFTRQVVKQ